MCAAVVFPDACARAVRARRRVHAGAAVQRLHVRGERWKQGRWGGPGGGGRGGTVKVRREVVMNLATTEVA